MNVDLTTTDAELVRECAEARRQIRAQWRAARRRLGLVPS